MNPNPDAADELAVVFEGDGTRVVALLDPALIDSPLRRSLRHRTAADAPTINPPGETR
ncbi:hypothetical protein [Streptomyces sp. AC1-42T]|uniref:hypothetical protein n=1 Tax=Streptomyces sp. AC1-42T TaxID=2218665 RepID=UPI001314EDEE|nr:hypothetical protein [Streptomyces sp. AC1-42T]